MRMGVGGRRTALVDVGRLGQDADDGPGGRDGAAEAAAEQQQEQHH